MTDYEKIYQTTEDACGAPFLEFEQFFAMHTNKKLSVLDLGCGQGRDALMIARLGHRVLGVDLSPTGVGQMVAVAKEEGLAVEGITADITTFKSTDTFDIILLDRVIHMLASAEAKLALLEKAATLTRVDGHILIADTPSNLPMIERFFDTETTWELVRRKKGFRFYRKLS